MGGGAEVVTVAEVPVGMGGVSGLMDLTVLTETKGHRVPALLGMRTLQQLDSDIRLGSREWHMRSTGATAPPP